MVSTRILTEPVGLFSSRSLKEKYGRARLLDDAFDHAVNGRVVAAFEVRHFDRHQIRMARRELSRPDLVVGARE